MTLAAVLSGLAMVAVRQPPMVGYILAGVILGPTVLGFVPQIDAIPLVAEFGVLFLLFVVGMEMSLKAFIADVRPAVLTVAGQLGVGLAVMSVFGWARGWDMQQVILLAFIVTMSSTAVGLKILEDMGELRTGLGRIVVAILIAQDIAIVPMLILTATMGAGGTFDLTTLVSLIVAVAGLLGFVAYFGPRGKLHFPLERHILGRVELVTLAALAVCCTAATITGLLHLSPAYGAFFAGLYIGKTTLRSEAINAMEPIQGVLMVLFFVAIGLLLDVDFILANWALVGSFVASVLVLKSLANILILRYVGLRWTDAYQAGLITGQIGEFAFILAAIGLANTVLDPIGYKLAIAVIVLSLLFSPLWISAVRRVHAATQGGIEDLKFALLHGAEGAESAAELTRRHHALRRAYGFLPQRMRIIGAETSERPARAGESPRKPPAASARPKGDPEQA